MENLSLTRALPLHHADRNIPRSTRRASLGSVRRRRNGGRCVAVRSAIGGDTTDFSIERRRKDVEAKASKEQSRHGGGGGLVIGEERDESGSLVGLSFICLRYFSGTPADKKFARTVDLECNAKINCFGGVHEVGFFHEYRKGVDWVFVDHSSYHRPGNPYGDSYGAYGDNQVGFSPLTKESMLEALRTAIRTYQEHKASWEGLMKRGMAKDCSWDNAAVQYEQAAFD